jgi:dUTP pyrophosphatase
MKFYHERDERYIPARATDGSAGYDCRADIDHEIIIHPGHMESIPLGWRWSPEGDENVALLILPRSGLGLRGVTLSNSVGLIDPDYRGEVSATLINHGWDAVRIRPGDRVCQALPIRLERSIGNGGKVPAGFDSSTARGAGGHGSTGMQ